jgi:hypothetical protein
MTTTSEFERIESLPGWARGHAYRLTLAGLSWAHVYSAGGEWIEVHGCDDIVPRTSPHHVRDIIEGAR